MSDQRTWRRLRRDQIGRPNLTSFESDPQGGHLMDIAYPLTSNKHLLNPEHLAEYSVTHEFPTLKCFHDIPARYFTVTAREYANRPLIGCGHDPDYRTQCGYLVTIADIAISGGQRPILTYAYPKGMTTSEKAMEAYKRRLKNPAVYRSLYRRRQIAKINKLSSMRPLSPGSYTEYL